MCLEEFRTLRTLDAQAKLNSVPTVAAAHPNCECEVERVSEFSVGPVIDDEVICRLVFSEHHFNTVRNEPLPMLFEDAFTRGASAFRSPAMRLGQIHAMGREREKTNREKNHTYIGFVAADARSVRGFRYPTNDETRRMCVYDTAQEDQPHHVDIYSAIAIANSGEERKLRQALRNELALRVFARIERAPPREAA